MKGRATINEGEGVLGEEGGRRQRGWENSRYLVIKIETAVRAREGEVISRGRGGGGVGREGDRGKGIGGGLPATWVGERSRIVVNAHRTQIAWYASMRA